MSNPVAKLFSVINTTLCGETTEEVPNDDGTITVTKVIRPILKDKKRQYTSNIKVSCDSDPNHVFRPEVKSSVLKKLLPKDSKVTLTGGNYVIQKRNGTVTPTHRPKDESGKFLGWCSQVYVPKYVRPAGKSVPSGSI